MSCSHTTQRPPPSPSPSPPPPPPPPPQGIGLRPPLDLSHHLSQVTKRRTPSSIKEFYRYFSIPDIGNLGGGLPNDKLFPFDTLEAQAASPDRYPCTSKETQKRCHRPGTISVAAADDDGAAAATSSHITIPKTMPPQTDPLERVDLSTALQYGTAGGYPPLLSLVRQFTRDLLHPSVPYRDGPAVILTCGSTDGFAKAAQLLVDSWDPVPPPLPAPPSTDPDDDGSMPHLQPRWRQRRPGMLCEMFVYNNALASVEPLGVQVVPVPVDGDGILVHGPGGLWDILEGWDPRKGRRPHFIYTVTIGHNPTGHVVPLQRKREIYATCQRFDVIIVEDEPYWNLQFASAAEREAESRGIHVVAEGNPTVGAATLSPQRQTSGYEFLDSLVPSYLSIDVDGRVIRLDTFSKTVAPGCRLGWITAQPAFIERLERITETTTQQPSGFVQAMIVKLLMGSNSSSGSGSCSEQEEAANTTTTATATAFSAFHRLSARDKSSDTKQQRHRFRGWKMDGWVRWLEGLRGVYERRMTSMCTCLDKGLFQLDLTQTPSTTTTAAAATDLDPSWGVITKTRIMSYDWPRGGMFVWVRIHLENHPLWRRLDGPALARALLVFLTRRPHLVIVAPGSMFAATPAVAAAEAWRYLRLCFGTEAEDRIAPCARRFVAGLQGFWQVTSVLDMQRLLDGDDDDDRSGHEEDEVAYLDYPANLGF